MINQYLFVHSRSDRTFPERLRVTRDEEKGALPGDAELTGTVRKEDVDTRRVLLEQEYPAPTFQIATAWANSWAAVENNYAGLNRDSGPAVNSRTPLVHAPADPTTSAPSKVAAPGQARSFVCPECGTRSLTIEVSIELGSDSRDDECSLQAIQCQSCDLVGVGIYQESRRGAGESWTHLGYRMAGEAYRQLRTMLKACPSAKNEGCSCKTHGRLAVKNDRGLLEPLGTLAYEASHFPMVLP